MIAIALACDPPELLIADEATTALDVTTQAQIIDLVADLQRKRGMAVVWISHDLGVIGRIADRVMVMREGRIVESRDVAALFDDPQDPPYSKKLLDSRPLLSKVEERDTGPALTKQTDEKPVLQAHGLGVEYVVRGPTGRSVVHAIDGVDLQVARGSDSRIVGESGSGKSTVAGVVTGLIESGQGTTVTGSVTVSVDGREVEAVGVRGTDEALLRRRVAMVFQDPTASLDPRMTVASSITEPLRAHGLVSGRDEMRGRAEQLLADVSLDSSFLGRYPHEMSGGQRQRVCIARAGLRAGDPHPRRVDRVARRLRAGRCPRPSLRAATGEGPHVPLHRTRPRGRRADQRHRCGDAERQGRRDRPGVAHPARSRNRLHAKSSRRDPARGPAAGVTCGVRSPERRRVRHRSVCTTSAEVVRPERGRVRLRSGLADRCDTSTPALGRQPHQRISRMPVRWTTKTTSRP